MKTIYKYKLLATDTQDIELPVGAEILTVQEQFGDAVMWALVDTNVTTETRTFQIVGTGHDASAVDGAKYINTFQLNSGHLVFHLFEI